MKHEVKIGLVQMRCSADSAQNLEKALLGIRECADKGAQIVSVSELFRTQYFCQGRNEKNFDFAESIQGETFDALAKLAQEKAITIIGSVFEKADDGKFYNTNVVIGPDGKMLGRYRKTHIPSLPPGLYEENFYFEKAPLDFPVFKTPHARISTLICYDQWFPEPARICAANGAEILFYPTAIGWDLKPRTDADEIDPAEYEAWLTIQRSHAIANNIFVVAVNRVGVEGDLDFWGTSFVSDPYGRVIAKASSHKEENLVVTCDLGLIERMRTEWPFLEERRVRCEIVL